MRNVNTDPDPLIRVRDDDLGQIIRDLDQMYIGLSDLEAAPALNDEPAIQRELHHFGKIARAAADLLFHFRERSHR